LEDTDDFLALAFTLEDNEEPLRLTSEDTDEPLFFNLDELFDDTVEPLVFALDETHEPLVFALEDYKYIKIEDYPEAQILPHFETAFEFINEGMQSGCVLVHCNAGVSRSVTVVVAYLMKTKNMSLKQALDLVKTKRPTMCPNEGFQTQLQTYEKAVSK
jgi:protein-tyrosine phosphatase